MQVGVNLNEHGIEIRTRPVSTHETDPRIELVNVAVGADPRVRFRYARPVEQRRLSQIAGLGVDACHQVPSIILTPMRVDRAKRKPLRTPIAADMPAPAARQWFRRRLLAWYRRHGRDLPWRETRDPYHILVSEVMLQQTQVDRVEPKYHEWLGRYPTLEALAAAPVADA